MADRRHADSEAESEVDWDWLVEEHVGDTTDTCLTDEETENEAVEQFEYEAGELAEDDYTPFEDEADGIELNDDCTPFEHEADGIELDDYTPFEHKAGIKLKNDVNPFEHEAGIECTPHGIELEKDDYTMFEDKHEDTPKKGAGHRGRTKSERRNDGFKKTWLCNIR